MWSPKFHLRKIFTILHREYQFSGPLSSMRKSLSCYLHLLNKGLASKAYYWETTGPNQMGNAPKHFTISASPPLVKASEQPGNGQNVVGETFGSISHLYTSIVCSKIPLCHLTILNI